MIRNNFFMNKERIKDYLIKIIAQFKNMSEEEFDKLLFTDVLTGDECSYDVEDIIDALGNAFGLSPS